MRIQLVSHTPFADEIFKAASLASDPHNHEGLASPLGGIFFTFGAEGVSRSVIFQLTRHDLCSLNVASQRYMDESSFEYLPPPSVLQNPEALALFEEAMSACQRAYKDIYGLILSDRTNEYERQDGRDARVFRSFERAAMEDAGYLIPSAAQVRLTFGMSALNLLEFFRLRCCFKGQWEMRELADEMLVLCKAAAPAIFEDAGPSCMGEECAQGTLSCGRAIEMREKYSNL